MPRFSLSPRNYRSHCSYNEDESSNSDTVISDSSSCSTNSSINDDEEELPHPLGFSSSYGRTRFSFEPQFDGEEEYDDHSDDDDDNSLQDEDISIDSDSGIIRRITAWKGRDNINNNNNNGALRCPTDMSALMRHHNLLKSRTSYQAMALHEGSTSRGMDRIAALLRAASLGESKSSHYDNAAITMDPADTRTDNVADTYYHPSTILTHNRTSTLDFLLSAAETERKALLKSTQNSELRRQKMEEKTRQQMDALRDLISRDERKANEILERDKESMIQEQRDQQLREEKFLEFQKQKEEKLKREQIVAEKQKEKEEEALRNEKLEKERQLQELRQKQQNQKKLEEQEKVQKEDLRKQQAMKNEHILRAQKMIAQLKQVRAQLEPFEKNKERATSKRRMGMKKIARGKVSTLSRDVAKINNVVQEVWEAIQKAKQEDDFIRQKLGDANEKVVDGFTYTRDMGRGGRYLIDLIASGVVVRAQAESFGGTNGDGFPLAAFLTHLSIKAGKEFVLILQAHLFSVCSLAIPTLPKTDDDCSQDELMERLGMKKDEKSGEYETFSQFMARTEGIISLMTQIMSSKPSEHILFGGQEGALKWLRRFLDATIPEDTNNTTSTLPLMTAPILVAFLTAAGHMLANKFRDEFEPLLEKIIKEIMTRLDKGSIGEPSSVRLGKLLEGGIHSFQTTLPQGAIREFYNADPSASPQARNQDLNQSNNSFSTNPISNASPFSPNATETDPNTISQQPHFQKLSPPSNPYDNALMNDNSGVETSGMTQSPFASSDAPTFSQSTTTANNPISPFAMNTSSATSPFPGVGGSTNPSPFNVGKNTNLNSFGVSGAPFNASPFGPNTAMANASPFGTSNTTLNGNFSSSSNNPFKSRNSNVISNASMSDSNTTRPPCKFFQKGQCRNGKNCRFSHEINNSNPNHGVGSMSSNSSPSPFGDPNNKTNITSSPFGVGSMFNSSTNVSSSPFGNGSYSRSTFGVGSGTGSNSFVDFNSNNTTPNPSPFGVSTNSTNSFRNSNPTSHDTNAVIKQPCTYFAKGKCRYGSNCKFSHSVGGIGNTSGFTQTAFGKSSENSNNNMWGASQNKFTGSSPFGGPRR